QPILNRNIALLLCNFTAAADRASEKHAQDEVMLQVYEAKIQNLTETMARYKKKCDELLVENEALGRSQAKFTNDKQDILEFLNIKVGEYEKDVSSLEQRIRQLEEEKRALEARSHIHHKKLSTYGFASKAEVEVLQVTCAKYRTELDQLNDFKGRKGDLEQQLKNLKALLEQKEKEYKDTVHGMERKILQDKNQMKKEMLQKINEAVANFRRVADQQMAETTKRAIRENMAITTQLKKMSAKTIELIAENEALTSKCAKLKTTNALLDESERELAKKNQANQRVLKMLVEKLKGSDRMLELAYEVNQNQEDEDMSPVMSGSNVFSTPANPSRQQQHSQPQPHHVEFQTTFTTERDLNRSGSAERDSHSRDRAWRVIC
ncbi:hypothetical protein BJ742DRAFT_685065, partial [Cladochytrium replicatum]